MTLLLAGLVSATVIGGAAGWAVGTLAEHALSRKGAARLYFALLTSSVLPYGFFVAHTVEFGVQTYGPYPGLDSFVHTALWTTGGLVLLSWLVGRWSRFAAAFLPSVLFLCNHLFVVGTLRYQIPGDPLYDNKPSIALLVVAAGATALLALFARSTQGKRGLHRTAGGHRLEA